MDTKDQNNSSKSAFPGGVSKAKMAGWKKEHGKVYKIQVEVSVSETLTGYLREPSRDQYGTCAQIAQKKTALAGGEFLLNNCWLGGDDRIKSEDKVYISAAMSAMELFDFLPSSISEV